MKATAEQVRNRLDSARGRWFRWQKAQWQKRHNPQRKSRVVFLVGAQRSGTNLMVRSLDHAREVEPYNESDPRAFRDYRLLPLDHISQLVAASYAPVVLFKPLMDTYHLPGLLEHFAGSCALYAIRHFDAVIASRLKAFHTDPRARVAQWLAGDFAEFADARPAPATSCRIRSART